MKILVYTIRIFEENASMKLLNTILMIIMVRANLSVRKVAFHLVDVINPWPPFHKE